MGLGGEGEAWYVVGKDLSRNTLLVERGDLHPALYADTLVANQFTWIDTPPASFPYSCRAKVRYRQEDQPCTLFPIENGAATISFDTPQRAITPGQSVVFYQGDICLGGGIIQSAGPSYYTQKKTLANFAIH